ncbi:MAG: YfhO family protein [Lachnospiraceae bacterium]|nr:YfhO family protein [Lachnospiraceae bacterium]
MKNYKKIIITAIIALTQILILVFVINTISKASLSNLDFSQDELLIMDKDTNLAAGYKLDGGDAASIVTPEMYLRIGAYTISIDYEIEGKGVVYADYSKGSLKGSLSGIINFDSKSDNLSFNLTNNERGNPTKIYLSLNSSGDGDYLLVKNVSISASAIGVRYYGFICIFLFILFDIVLYCFYKRKKLISMFNSLSINQRFISGSLLFTIFLISMPALVGYSVAGADFGFHLMRIEGLKDGFLAGQFPVRIQPSWLSGHGYATSIMYGDLFLYLPALLRWFGLPLYFVYNLYIIIINIATVLIAYYCFRKISGQSLIGLMMAVFYSANIYRLINIYNRSAVGEYTAITFLPLIALGLYILITKQNMEEYKKAWIPLVIGYSGIIISHAITMLMVFGFTLLTIIILIKKIWQKEKLLQLVKAFILIILLNAWFLVPFIDYMQYDWVGNTIADPMHHVLNFRRQAVFVPQFFMSDYNFGAGQTVYQAGVRGDGPLSIGMSSALILATGLLLKGDRKRESRNQEVFLYIMIAFTMFTASTLFPWHILSRIIPLTAYVAKSLQFPFRLNAIIILLVALLAGLTAQKIAVNKNIRYGFIISIIVISCWQGSHFVSNILSEMRPQFIYEIDPTRDYVTGGEYLPAGVDPDNDLINYINEITIISKDIQVIEWNNQLSYLEIKLINSAAQTFIEVPRVNYKGYQARHLESNNLMAISDGNLGRLQIEIPADFSGTLKIEFISPFYWRIAEFISLITLVYLLMPAGRAILRKVKRRGRIV